MDAREEGFELERLIHEAALRIPGVTHCKREAEIRAHLNDASLNGIDHWIQVGSVHIFIQDKWKETIGQQEVAQFLGCVDRLKGNKHIADTDTTHLIWASKTRPSKNCEKLLKEKECHTIISHKSIGFLAKSVISTVCLLLNVSANDSLATIVDPVAVKVKPAAAAVAKQQQQVQREYDDTEEGKVELQAMRDTIQKILSTTLLKIQNCTSIPYDILNSLSYPRSVDEWFDGKITKIDFNKFLRGLKENCVPTVRKPVRSEVLFFYVKMMKLSDLFAKDVAIYEQRRKALLAKKSKVAKQLPALKCEPQLITEALYKSMCIHCSDFYFNSMANGQIVKRVEPRVANAFYTYDCVI